MASTAQQLEIVRSAASQADRAYENFRRAMSIYQLTCQARDFAAASVARVVVVDALEDYLDHARLAYQNLPAGM